MNNERERIIKDLERTIKWMKQVIESDKRKGR